MQQWRFYFYLEKSFVIHEGNTKQISTMTVTLYLIKPIDVRKNTNEHRFYINEHGILYKITTQLASEWESENNQ